MNSVGKRKLSSTSEPPKNPTSVTALVVADVNGDNGVDVVVADAEPLVVAHPLQSDVAGERGEGREENRIEDSEEEEDEDDDMEDVDDASVLAGKGSPLDGTDFYEVEAILRKKFIKGKAHYLIKWLGWSHSDNTWEPLENLDRVRDVVAAFEERLNTEKQRKGRRKSTGSLSGVKRRIERSLTPYSLRRFPDTTASHHAPPAPPPPPVPLTDFHHADIPAFPQPVIFADEVENVAEGNDFQRGNRVANEEPEYDPKLIELRSLTNNGHDTDRLSIQFQENNAPDPDDFQSNGFGQESDQSDRRRGSKKRKSGSVKRFNKDLYPGESSNPNGTSDVAVEPRRRGPSDTSKKVARAKPPSIIGILRPLNCSPQVPTGVKAARVVTFIVKRSDGEEVMVDNEYLKKDYPEMLIDFYEMHLRHSPAY